MNNTTEAETLTVTQYFELRVLRTALRAYRDNKPLTAVHGKTAQELIRTIGGCMEAIERNWEEKSSGRF